MVTCCYEFKRPNLKTIALHSDVKNHDKKAERYSKAMSPLAWFGFDKHYYHCTVQLCEKL